MDLSTHVPPFPPHPLPVADVYTEYLIPINKVLRCIYRHILYAQKPGYASSDIARKVLLLPYTSLLSARAIYNSQCQLPSLSGFNS